MSTGYDLNLDNPTAQSLPLGDPNKEWKEKTLSPVTLRRTINQRLEGFQVQSNSTGMLHTEMMLDLAGSFSANETLSEIEIANGTQLNISKAAVFRRNSDGQLEGAWIGDLAASSQTEKLTFESIDSLYGLWAETEDLQPDLALAYWKTLKDKIQNDDNGVPKVSVLDIQNGVPELSERWDEFLRVAMRFAGETDIDLFIESSLSNAVFAQTVNSMYDDGGINVKLIFQSIIDNLAISKGETRMLAVTDQPVGSNAFNPASTQTLEQTLVVVHLKRPDLEPARRDVNAVEDYSEGRSNLDWAEEQEDLNEASDEKSAADGDEGSDGDSDNSED